MAVPKKRTSKSQKNTRQFVWTQKTKKEALKAISLAKSLLKNAFSDKLSKSVLGFSKKVVEVLKT
jgi:ribosomal protein L32